MKQLRSHALILAVATAFVLAGADVSRAEIAWDQKTVSLKVDEGAKDVRGEFRFTNRGDHTVKFVKMKTSCGCLTARLEKNVVSPGESESIQVELKGINKQGITEKAIIVETDDGPASRVVLLFRVEVADKPKADASAAASVASPSPKN